MLGGLTRLVKSHLVAIVLRAVTLLLDALRYDCRGVSNGAVLGPGRAFARERFAFPISTPGVYSRSSRGAVDTQQ